MPEEDGQMKIAVITLSVEGARVALRLCASWPQARLFRHGREFASIVKLTRQIFRRYNGLVYVAPCGVVVRAIAPVLEHKTTDPAVVVLDVGARYAVSLLSGHEGGANRLALEVANVLGAEPVISTTTEAMKNLIVGVGCRRGAAAAQIEAAVREALRRVGAGVEEVRWLASASLKANEAGLLEAAERLGVPLRFISADEICSTAKRFRRSKFVTEKVKLPAVAEPSALLAGRRTQLLLPKIIVQSVTVAVARESCL
jgi:cobalt-precorrin 5A hydrolase